MTISADSRKVRPPWRFEAESKKEGPPHVAGAGAEGLADRRRADSTHAVSDWPTVATMPQSLA